VLGGGAAGAAAGRAAGYAFGVFVALLLTVRAFGRGSVVRNREASVGRRRLMRYAGALLVIDTAFALSGQLSPLMIGGFLGAKQVGLFQAPARLIVLLQYPALSVANAVAPGLARRDGHEPDVRTFDTALRYILVFQGLLIAPVLVWAGPITQLLLGDGYERSADVLRALAPFIFCAGLSPLVGMGLNYLGEARLRLPISILDLVLTVALMAALLPTVGLLGAAIAADVSATVYIALHVWVIRRTLAIPLRGTLLAIARSLLAAGAMALVMLAFGTRDLSVIDWVAGSVCGFAAFAAVLLLTRQVTVPELRAVWGGVRARLPGGGRDQAR
jgi:O-antigen/teichoic acid export membrane protein